MDDEIPPPRIATWTPVAVVECVWTPLTPTYGGGELDFSDPDNSGLLPDL